MKIDPAGFMEALVGSTPCHSGEGEFSNSTEARSFMVGRYGEKVQAIPQALRSKARPWRGMDGDDLRELARDLRSVATAIEELAYDDVGF